MHDLLKSHGFWMCSFGLIFICWIWLFVYTLKIIRQSDTTQTFKTEKRSYLVMLIMNFGFIGVGLHLGSFGVMFISTCAILFWVHKYIKISKKIKLLTVSKDD